jgi:predicted nucleic acid-binding protein
LEADHALIVAGYDVARAYGCALYDALYLALAERTSAMFVHADRRLRNTHGGSHPLEMWIGDLAL